MSKIKRKACKDLKELNKIIRKYTKRFFGVGRGNWRYHNYWYTWVWVDYIGMEKLNDPYLNKHANDLAVKGYPNLKHILQEVKDNYNTEFISKKDGNKFYLRGVEISNEDYYWIYVSNEGTKKYSSCVGSFTNFY